MNNNLITKMNGILLKYKNSIKKENDNNQYIFFRHLFINYYKPFMVYIYNELKKEVKTVEDLLKYKDYILDILYDELKKEILLDNDKDSDFINKLSYNIYTEFNQTMKAYKNLSSDSKKQFFNSFIFNKNNALFMILEKNPEIFIKTVANLKSPLMQFYILNNIENFEIKLNEYFNNCSEIKMKMILIDNFFYPSYINPKDYYHLWIGNEFIHIKFAKKILNEKYENAKEFLKLKDEYESAYIN